MKRILYIVFILILCASFSTGFTACRSGYGCPAEEQYKENQGKPLSTKRGKSKLFKKQ